MYVYRFPYRLSTSGEKSRSPPQAGDADVDQKESKTMVFRLYDDWGAGVSLLNFIAGNETETKVEPSNASNETTKAKEGHLQVESSDKAKVEVGKEMDDDDLDLEDEDDLPESERAEKTSSQPSERESEEKKVKPHPYLVTR
jgi:hypothetical protein